ncbi:MAG TPA: mercuric reductase, partial [Bryobacteraceae bacterium]|nr:mercuric reductase [Bryobacteraceae bacterium]
MMDHYELLVIGSGEAGKYLSWNMAKQGWRTALVERRVAGGSCPNIACMPSKNIIHSARVASLVRRAEEFGLAGSVVSTIDMPRVFRRKQTMVEALRQINVDLFASTGVDFMLGEARFVSPDSVSIQLKNGGERAVSADRIVLSLGSRSTIPAVPGLADAQPMTHVEALDLTRVPDHLIILGGNYVGLEFAQAFRRFGSRVTIIERRPRLASREDEDVSAAILDLFYDEGIDVVCEASILQVHGVSGREVRVRVDTPERQREIPGSDILVAAGRVPNTDSIDLEAAGVQTDSSGYIVVDERLATTAPNIWAVGDCAGSPQFTHAAYDDFCVLKANFTGDHRSIRGRLVSSCLFIDPELVHIGLNESQARALGVAYRLFSMPMSNVLRTRAIAEPRGFMKMLVDVNSDQILGFTAIGAEASEMLAAVQTAMLGKLPYTLLRDGMFAHPTMSEGLVFLLSGD